MKDKSFIPPFCAFSPTGTGEMLSADNTGTKLKKGMGINIIMNSDEIVSGLILELRRGTLIILVLSQLRNSMYGYNLVKKLNDSGIPMEANTLYPLMRRLESQGLLKSEWETSEAKPRKYYQITEDGLAVLEKATLHWQSFSKNVDSLLEV